MKFITIIISLLIGFIIFIPRENLFFTLQKELKKENIFINTKTSSNLFYLHLNNSTIFVNGIDIAKIENSSFLNLIIFNKLDIHNININFNNLTINNLTLTYNIFNPFIIHINGLAKFANITGNINLKNKNIKIYLLNLTNKTLKGFLQKDKKGYFYAQNF